MAPGSAQYRVLDDRAISVQWRLSDGSTLMLAANLGSEPATVDCHGNGEVLFASDSKVKKNVRQGSLNPWSVIFYLKEARK